MRNPDSWKPSKFEVSDKGLWQASGAHVPIGSRLAVDCMAEAYANAVLHHACGKLLDLGCGPVPLYGMYRALVSEVTCVDWPNSLHAVEHVDVYADLNEVLELDNVPFDTIIATDVLEHLHSPDALFETAKTSLRVGGTLIVGVPFLYWVHEAPHDYYRYTAFALRHMASKAGLEVMSISPYAGAPEVLSDLLAKIFGSRPRVAQMAYNICKIALKAKVVRKLSLATRESIPLGYVMIARRPLLESSS